MHLSLDSINMADDGYLSSDNYHDLGKGGGAAMGGRLHSIDVILGFSKEQDPLLTPMGPAGARDVLAEQGKQVTSDPYAHLPSISDNSHQAAYHGEEIVLKYITYQT